MTTLQSLDHNPSITFSGAGIPSASIVGAALNDVYLNTTSGESFVCTDATFGAQQWLGDQGNKNAPITSFDHPDLVAAYTMDNISGSTLVDESPNGNDGTITGAVAVSGLIGNSLDFDGVNDAVTGAVKLPLSADFTLCLWVNVASLPTSNANIFGQYDLNPVTDPGRTLLRYQATGELFLFAAGVGTSNLTVSSGTIFVVVERSGNTFSLSSDLGTPVTAVSSTAIQDVHSTLGANYGESPALVNFLDGWIDQLRLFDRALTTDEITTLYNGGVGA